MELAPSPGVRAESHIVKVPLLSFAGVLLSSDGPAAHVLDPVQSSFTGATVVHAGPCAIALSNDCACWQQGNNFAVMDGVLFEQDELRHALGLDKQASAAAIVFHAYERWGVDFADHLYGEFSIALWNAANRTLVLGRDAMSRIPLLYVETPQRFAFASDIESIFRFDGVEKSVDEEAFCAMMSIAPAPGKTLFRGVRTLPGNHVATVVPGGTVKTHRYWFPLRQGMLQLRDWREYSELLREEFYRAVEVRVPAEGLVAAHLSSGFDSSAVAALTAQVLAKQNRPLIAYTAVPVTATDAAEIVSNRFDNEWPLAAQVAAMYPNIEHVAIRNDASDWFDAMDCMIRHTGGAPGFLRNARWYHGIQVDAQKRGVTLLMEGQAGNLTSSYDGGFELFDLRRRGMWGAMLNRMRAKHRRGATWKSLVRQVWVPGAKAAAVINKLQRRPAPELFELSMMRREFYERHASSKKRYSAMGNVIEGDRTNGAAWRLSLLDRMDLSAMRSLYRNGFGIERTDPTADRRLVEFCLRMPDAMFSPDGERKGMYRHAMRNDLPAQLLTETRRGLQASDFLLMFEEAMPLWQEELRLQEQSAFVGEYLDVPRMRALLDSFDANVAANRAKADMLYNYTFGGAIGMGRMLRNIAP